jgi:hypothetical protein
MTTGYFSIDTSTRRAKGVLVPFGVMSRGPAGNVPKPVKMTAEGIRVPRDPMVVGLNDEHQRYVIIGRADVLEKREDHVYAEFAIADDDAADRWLADHPEGAYFSVELDEYRIVGDEITGRIAGAAATDNPAFDGTIATFSLVGEPVEDDEETTDEAEAETEDESDEEPTEEEEEDAVAAATAQGATFGSSTGSKKSERRLTRGDVFQAVQRVASGQGTGDDLALTRTAMAASAATFALEDITYNDTGDLVTYLPKQWLGEVDDGTQYTPIFAELFGQQTLSSLAMTGWKWNAKPVGGTWTGNKTEIPSDPVTFTQVNENATRWANGNDIAREHRDFGTPGFFEAYDRLNREAFYRWLDETIVLTEALAGATDLEADNPSGLSIGAGWSALIDGASAIVAAGLKPTGAVVDLALWKSMLKTPSSDVLGYLSGAIGLETGDLAGFQIRPYNFSGGADGHILVVARSAADVYTLPGSPIRAEALNISLGGIDVGYFGYGGFLIKNALGIVDVAPYTP